MQVIFMLLIIGVLDCTPYRLPAGKGRNFFTLPVGRQVTACLNCVSRRQGKIQPGTCMPVGRVGKNGKVVAQQPGLQIVTL